MAIVDSVKRVLGFTAAKDRALEASIKAEKAVESVERLEESQRTLRGAIEDTGFFLGDALMIERPKYERSREGHYNF